MTPTATAQPDLVIARDALEAMRLGEHPHPLDGIVVIGYRGIARLLGYQAKDPEQTVRKLASTPGLRFPPARFTVRLDGADVALFALEEVKEWSIQTGRLHPDGVTPLQLKPRRGSNRPR